MGNYLKKISLLVFIFILFFSPNNTSAQTSEQLRVCSTVGISIENTNIIITLDLVNNSLFVPNDIRAEIWTDEFAASQLGTFNNQSSSSTRFQAQIPIATYLSWSGGASNWPPKVDFFYSNSRLLFQDGSECKKWFSEANLEIPTNIIVPQTCSSLRSEYRTNKFECDLFNGSWRVGTSYCQNGYFPDYNTCSAAAGIPSGNFACMPCVPNNQGGSLSHGDLCNPQDDQCSRQSGNNLSCRKYSFSNVNACQYPIASRGGINERTCIVGSDECFTNDSTLGAGRTAVVCANSFADYQNNKGQIQSCNSVITLTDWPSCTRESEGQTDLCSRLLGENSVCYNGKCVPFIASLPTPTPPRAIPTNYIGLSPTPSSYTHFEINECVVSSVFDETSETVEKGIQTAFGCIPTSVSGLTRFIFRIALGISGGIAFLLIIFAGITMMMSTGDPKKLQESKELLTSAIVGLLLIIFSVFILRLIGYNILAIPGFG